MDERGEMEKIVDELMLPGFRFHPTDEELVGFYLKRKIQKKPLSIELIKQLDIYKYNPWDLPKLAATGEKEWYFYCLRDRKYRNSARPNRVTGSGFWKATGTDRPVYSSEQPKCIGLKKSLVFYKGRAAKGIKTDWMMHEFRLPSPADSSLPNRLLDKSLSANDSWAICRIFKKNNTIAQRALAHSWIAPLPERDESDMFSVSHTNFVSTNTAESGSTIQFSCNSGPKHIDSPVAYSPLDSPVAYSPLDTTSYAPVNLNNCKSSLLPFSSIEIPPNFMSSLGEISIPSKGMDNVASMLLNLSPTILGDVDQASATINFGQPEQYNGSGSEIDLPLDVSTYCGSGDTADAGIGNNNQWSTIRSFSFPFNLPSNLPEEWKYNLPWESQPPCPSEMSATY